MYSGTPLGWLIVACFSTCSSLLIKTAQTLGGSRLSCISKTTRRLFFIYRRSTAQHGGESTSVVTGNKTEAVSFIRWPVEFLRKVLFSPLLLFYLTGMRPGVEYEIVKLRSVALKFDFFFIKLVFWDTSFLGIWPKMCSRPQTKREKLARIKEEGGEKKPLCIVWIYWVGQKRKIWLHAMLISTTSHQNTTF